MGEFDDLIPEYITESTELLQTVESGLLDLESGTVEEDTIHTVFRAIHSIKGGAGFVGLEKIEHLAHRMEDLLNLIRNGDLQATQPVTDALLQSLDVLNLLFESVGDQDGIDIEGPMRALDAALNAGVGEEVRQGMEPVTPSPQSAGLPAFQVSEYNLRSKLKGSSVYHVHLNLSQVEERGLTPIQLVNEMLSMGEILDSIVNLPKSGDPEKAEPVEPAFDVLYATVLEPDLLSAALRLDEGEFRELGADDFGLGADGQKPASETGPGPQPEPEGRPAPPPAPVQAAEPQPPAPLPAASALVPAEPEEPAATRRAGEYLTFSLGEETYGVDVLSVQEIIGLPHLSKLPRSPNYVLGVMNLRGMVVPVLDMRLKLNLKFPDEGEPVVVVLHVSDKIMGAVVDGVNDVVELSDEQVQEPPDFVGSIRRDYLRGLSRREGDMLILLELDRLLAPETMAYAD